MIEKSLNITIGNVEYSLKERLGITYKNLKY